MLRSFQKVARQGQQQHHQQHRIRQCQQDGSSPMYQSHVQQENIIVRPISSMSIVQPSDRDHHRRHGFSLQTLWQHDHRRSISILALPSISAASLNSTANVGSSTDHSLPMNTYTTASLGQRQNQATHVTPKPHYHQAIQMRNKVFVSKHNDMDITRQNIVDYCENHGIRETELRINNSHVILRECPFCNASSKPTHGKASNLFKLYVQIGGGAYYCHRCGSKGSWYDFKVNIGGGPIIEGSGSGSGGGGSNRGGASRNHKSEGRSLGLQYQESPVRMGGSGAPVNYSKTGEPVPCLPMPSPRLTALHSSMLMDVDDHGNRLKDGGTNRVLDYLIDERGLTRQTLRKYGVGRAKYKYATNNGYESADSVTFPWLVKVSDIKIQESLRGAKFIYDRGETTVQSPAPTDAAKAVDGDTKTPAIVEKEGEVAAKAGVAPPDLDDVFVTRRIKARALDHKGMQRLDPKGGGWGLFGLHTVPDDSTEIILTEGEYDAMAVWQSTGRPAVSVPNGCRSLPVDLLPLLERFDKVYLWLDSDGPGQEGNEKFAKKIGLSRCYIVRCTDAKDANDALRMDLDLNSYIEKAERIQHDRILTFKNLRNEVIHEILNPTQYSGIQVPSLPIFTKTIKGFRRGEMTVFTGPTGSGKTTFLGQVSVDLSEQGINCLWGSFEIKNTRLMHKLLQQFGRNPLPTAGSERVEERLNALADRFENLPLYFMGFHGGSEVDEVLDAMEYAVYVNDVEVIILDNMQFMISRNAKGGSSYDKFDIQDSAIQKFRKFATEHNVHLVLVVHPRKEDESSKLGISSIYGSAKATQEADTVIIIQSDGKRKYIDVKKNRFDGTLGISPLFFDRKSGRYTEEEQGHSGGGAPNQFMNHQKMPPRAPSSQRVEVDPEMWEKILAPGPPPK